MARWEYRWLRLDTDDDGRPVAPNGSLTEAGRSGWEVAGTYLRHDPDDPEGEAQVMVLLKRQTGSRHLLEAG